MQTEYIDKYGFDSLPLLMDAIEKNADYFLTMNQALLKDRKEIEQKYPIKIITPEELLEQEK